MQSKTPSQPPAAPAPSVTNAVEDPERKWLREVYAGDHAKQLTPRAVVTGMLLGAVMSLSNLYVSLKTGWSFGVTITAGILAFGLFSLLTKLRVVRDEFTMLENNAMQSVASAAGYMTGGGTVAAIPAVMMATHSVMPAGQMFLWIAGIAMLGVFMAIPMKRQMINQEGLKFPSGIAAAETLKALHAASHAKGDEKGGEGAETGDGGRTRVLLYGAIFGAVMTWMREAKARWMLVNVPSELALPFKFKGVALSKWTLAFDTSPLLIAAGAIMGWRSAWSLMLGAVLNYGLLAPYGVSIGAIREVKYRHIVGWTVWFGSSMLLVAGLLAFAFSWRQIARAFGDMGSFFSTKKPAAAGAGAPYREDRRAAPEADPLANVEVPMQWFVMGTALFAPLVITMGVFFFGMKWWMGLLGVFMSFFIAVVASRATGETDTTPSGALGKLTQIVFGAVAPGSVTINLMSANLTAGVALHSADLLTDLKSGYLLGAKPRQQFVAQFFGVVAGSLMVVPAFRLLVPDHSVLGTPAAPAPGAVSWLSVAQVLAGGLSRLPTSARWLILAGASVGVVLTLLERALPKKAKRFLPSATGLGLAFTLPFTNALSMVLGAAVALWLETNRPKTAEKYLIAVSSGVIAGESLLGIVIAVLRDILHVLQH